jgi:3'-phosphoadenosine 5'-phosphosulfate sulfotransferase (PAPS reductase)/FAD synthetase
MNKPTNGEYRSRVYTDRPDYADFDAPQKFMAIESIIAKRLIEHPNAICSYSGGADSDIMLDVIERVRKAFNLPPIKYVFFNTGLEMQATKDHVKATAQKYGVEIETMRPKINIVLAARKYGIPFLNKSISEGMYWLQRRQVPLSIVDEYAKSEDKSAKYAELCKRYPRSNALLQFLLCCNKEGRPMKNTQLAITSAAYLLDFIRENPPDFAISKKCCDYCKKQVAHRVQKGFEMVITGERRDEGGMRMMARYNGAETCFAETKNGQYRLRPLYYVSNKDKAWYKDHYGIRYSDAYVVYGLTRTGCCGCPISYKAAEDLELIGRFEPKIKKAAWNIFGDSYRYRAEYNAYKARRMEQARNGGQITIFDLGC